MLRSKRELAQLVMAGTVLFLLSILLSAQTSSAVVIWQEDFNDGDYAGWTIYQGDFEVTGNALVANGSYGIWNFIRHPSTVAYGTWTFDVLSEDAPQNHTYAYIISGGIVDIPNYRLCIWTGSFVGWAPGPGVSLLKQNSTGTVSIADWFTGTLSGWHSYEVTRDQTGQFRILVDGTLRITVTDNEITSSGAFRFGAQENSGIDNIVVDAPATTTPTTTPPPAIPGFPLLAIFIAIPLALGVVAVIRRKNR
jgi:hypothetical protein